MNFLEVSEIGKKIGDKQVLEEISFMQQRGQHIAIMGESGSGKSTLLKIIAGLLQPDEGSVLFEGQRVKGPAERLLPGHPGIAYLSQHFELWPNYKVEEILVYNNQLSRSDAFRLWELCRIGHLLERRTDQLSGGERQRIALAHLLVSSPRLLLLDEPYSNLDLIHKKILRSVIKDLGEQWNITCLLASHDPLDTLPWADELLILWKGRIHQQGPPDEVRGNPADEYVAGLLGLSE